MEAQEGSLRTSTREQREVKLKPVHSSLHELAHQFVETRLSDRCVRQRLQPEVAQTPLKKGTFFVLENETRADPGFLLCLPNKPVLFMATRSGIQGKKPPAWTLRMRVDQSLGEGGGTLFIATLDKVQHILRIEDVWIWKGQNLYETETYTKRREQLKQFVERFWVPDARLMGGIQTTIANPKPLSSLTNVSTSSCISIDLIPDTAKRRRFTFFVEEPKAKPKPQPVQEPQPTPIQKQVEKTLQADAIRVDGLPDVYDLFTKEGIPLCRAAVQQLTLSQALRTQKEQKIPVRAEWKSEFGRYEILAIDTTPR
jgi:hypothetical protein